MGRVTRRISGGSLWSRQCAPPCSAARKLTYFATSVYGTRSCSCWSRIPCFMYFHTPTTRVFFTQSIRLVHQLIAARHNDANGFRVDPSLYPTDVGTTPCS
ncbi:uncharacterized protein LACBIDRAFT_312255 [Laccaria bicolor S238N-H82]|uniref:Predicted protein n=1 Tax=Laccaria bicolor (strain S238N-H82 / ATCC MYA-4686) TaxID=486041 RepID=B0DVT8_LACBS|nr:uncharacterized protein LACBIDRAFT_312255 [Laccaria bicolor S238N-H82]EDR01311.1 predicted protein [Laccaria bicolor S238N-H82]|eukprot:XP_001888018.1 predicted protein [Laccaria bicolor S238N-H82]